MGLGRVTSSSKGPMGGQYVFLMAKHSNLYGRLIFPLSFPQTQPLISLRMFTGLVFLDLRTFRAGQRLLPRHLTGNRIPAIILSLNRKPGPGVSKI